MHRFDRGLGRALFVVQWVATSLALGTCVSTCTPASPSPLPSPSTPPSPPASASPASPFEASVDTHLDPCADFYDYACGGWRSAHPIPPDRASISVYGEIEIADRAKERAIAEDAAKSDALHTNRESAEAHVGAYYAACLDTAAIEARGLTPIAPTLARIDAIRTPNDLADVVAELHAGYASVLFEVSAAPDARDTGKILLEIGDGKQGLPTRADYLDDTENAKSLRAKYRAYVASVLVALGASHDAAESDAQKLLAREIAIARVTKTDVERMNPEADYHRTTFDELAKQYPTFAFARYAADIGIDLHAPLNLEQPARLAASLALAPADLPAVRALMKISLVRAFAAVLPRAIDDLVFAFHRGELRGIKQKPAREERCLTLLDDDIGDELGRIFVARYLPAESRATAQTMVTAITAALRDDLASSAWLGENARAAAAKKLARIHVMVGGPDTWLDYTGLTLDPNDAFGNAFRARKIALSRDVAHVGKPTDRGVWGSDEPAQSLDGFTSHTQVIAGFTAGFLQPPIFDPAEDAPMHYGGVGGVVGHELSHHFDASGRKNDENGNLRPWWSEGDVAHYEERTACFAKQYSRYQAEDGTPLDGARTLNENIADNGGLRLAWNALRPASDGPKDSAGFTPAQRFFLAWARIRCENVTNEYAHRRAVGDGHSPGRFRVDGVVSNMPEFAQAFACKEGTPMSPSQADRCALW